MRRLGAAGDLIEHGAGSTINVVGTPERERDFGRWAGPLGLAILRGARVRRLS